MYICATFSFNPLLIGLLMHKFRMLFVILSCFLLTSCLVEEDNVEGTVKVSNINKQAMVHHYAKSLQQFALVSQSEMTSSSQWLEGNYALGLIDMSTSGGPASEYLQSAWCPVDSEQGMHLTWISTQEGGKVHLQGLGQGKTGGVLRLLQQTSGAEHLAVKKAGNLMKMTGTGSDVALPTGCLTGAVIPDGSPIMVFQNIRIPVQEVSETQKYEYRTVACPAEDIGSNTERLLVTYHKDGSRSAGGVTKAVGDATPFDNAASWDMWMEGCNETVSVPVMEVNMGSAAIVGGGSSFDVGGDPISTKEVECIENVVIRDGKVTKDVLEDMLAGDLTDDGLSNLDKGAILDEFSTCVSEDVITSVEIEGITRSEKRLTEYEWQSQECGGSAGSFTHNYNGRDVTVTHTDWNFGAAQGAVFRRAIKEATISAGEAGIDGSVLQQREKWEGYQLYCQRKETFYLSCSDFAPTAREGTTVTMTGSVDMSVSRIMHIHGWKDKVNMVRNEAAPLNLWNVVSNDCQWKETREITACADGTELVEPGLEQRTIRVANLSGRLSYSDWMVVDTQECGEIDPNQNVDIYVTLTGRVCTDISQFSPASIQGVLDHCSVPNPTEICAFDYVCGSHVYAAMRCENDTASEGTKIWFGASWGYISRGEAEAQGCFDLRPYDRDSGQIVPPRPD